MTDSQLGKRDRDASASSHQSLNVTKSTSCATWHATSQKRIRDRLLPTTALPSENVTAASSCGVAAELKSAAPRADAVGMATTETTQFDRDNPLPRELTINGVRYVQQPAWRDLRTLEERADVAPQPVPTVDSPDDPGDLNVTAR